MDRLPGTAGGAPSPSERVPGGFATDAVQRELVRLLDLTSGQRLAATVCAILGKGKVLLGLMGGLVEATTSVELQAGRTYEFTVAATEPRIVLSTARPVSLPGMNGAVSTGLLGPPQPPGLELVAEASSITRPPPEEADGSEGADRQQLATALASLRRSAPTAAALQSIHRLLGHDQEARVLRLPDSPQAADVERLRGTLKADLLQLLDRGADRVRPPHGDAVARELVASLNRIEVDNAQRAEQGAPQWLPLPVTERGDLRDARMFARFGDADLAGSGVGRGEGGAFTVVLLLDFTRLGQLRVDLQLRGAALSAVFVAVEPSTVHSLVRSLPALRERLEGEGLEIGSLTVRAAPAERLPIADLVSRPPSSTSMVDIRA